MGLLVALTANVSTFYPGEARKASSQCDDTLTGRMAMFDTWFHGLGADAVCIQEGRLPEEGRRQGVNYLMICASASPSGAGGVQIWLSDRVARHVTAEAIVSPWIMYVCIRMDRTYYLVCAHAPYEKAPQYRVAAFWDQLDGTLSSILRKDPGATILMGIDANARTGSVRCDAIGPCEPSDENENGGLFRATLSTYSLAAINTHHEAGFTWTGSRGHRARIDYMCAPVSFLPFVTTCRAVDEVDLATAVRDDHRPMLVKLEIPEAIAAPSAADAALVAGMAADRASRRIRPAKWSLNDPACVCRFQHLVGQFPEPVTRDPAEWLERWVDHVRASAEDAYSRHRQTPRKPWLSEESWIAIRSVADARRALRQEVRGQRDPLMWIALINWRLSLLMPENDEELEPRHVGAEGYNATMIVLRTTDGDLRGARVRAAVAQRALDCHLKFKKASIKHDRHTSLDGIATSAQRASDHGDIATTYRLVRALGGVKPRSLNGVR